MSDAAVQTRGLTKRYVTTLAVDKLDLDVPRGAVFGLLGPNGAGKSTTFGILCGWLHPTAGESTVLGVPSRRLHQLRGRVAALPQDARFPPRLSVLRTLEHYARLSGQSAGEAQSSALSALERVQLRDAAHLRGDELSHGMLKRVALAQALLGKPEVVFLDEPTAGLDPKVAYDVKQLIGALAPACTVVVSSHNLAELQEICSHGAILDRGHLVQSGTIDELTRRHAEIAIQFKPGASIPERELQAKFGADAVVVTHADGQASTVRIRFAGERDVSEVINEALAILLAARVPLLGVQRGTSLERAFLDATAR
jgi:ABC-2 type transport system ATP-binding protein